MRYDKISIQPVIFQHFLVHTPLFLRFKMSSLPFIDFDRLLCDNEGA